MSIERVGFHPSFFPDSIPLEPWGTDVENKKYRGSTVDVSYFDVLPPNIAERVGDREPSPTGYVLKEYKTDVTPQLHLFMYDGEGNKIPREKGPLLEHERVAILQKRQEVTRSYFADTLPEFVMPSLFFVGQNSKGSMSVFEIQDRLRDFIHPISNKQEYGAFVQTLSDEQKEQLSNEIEALKHKLIYLLIVDKESFHGLIPDFHGGNIVLTADGHVKTFDTNLYRDRTDNIVRQNLNFTLQGLIDMQRVLFPDQEWKAQRDIIEEYYYKYVFPNIVKNPDTEDDD